MDAAAITAIFSGMVLLVGAIGAVLLKILQALREIHLAVNSNLQGVLVELARVSVLLARQTGSHDDNVNAAAAVKAAEEHASEPLEATIKLGKPES